MPFGAVSEYVVEEGSQAPPGFGLNSLVYIPYGTDSLVWENYLDEEERRVVINEQSMLDLADGYQDEMIKIILDEPVGE